MINQKPQQKYFPGFEPLEVEKLEEVNRELRQVANGYQAVEQVDPRNLELFTGKGNFFIGSVAEKHPDCMVYMTPYEVEREFHRLVLADPGCVLQVLSNKIDQNSLFVPAVVPTITSIINSANLSEEARIKLHDSLLVFMNVVGTGPTESISRDNYLALRNLGFEVPKVAKAFANDIKLYFSLLSEAGREMR